jgi:hypothetical protein
MDICIGGFMRTTVSIDDDVFTIARQKSLKERVSLGHAISDLIRQGIRNAELAKSERPKPTSKYAVLGKRDEIITSEHVYKLLEQEGI